MQENASLVETLADLTHNAEAELDEINTLKSLEDWRVRHLGRKGSVARLMERLVTLPKEERPAIGQAANHAKDRLEAVFARRKASLARALLDATIAQERLDVTLEGRRPHVGYAHPTRLVLEDAEAIFQRMGFSVVEGYDVEWDYYNFQQLNIPPDHPARDMQDTFYLSQERGMLLRTHTSPMQIRFMERQRPPIRIIVPGRAHRRDDDATHSPIFWQIEGLAVDTNITFSDLKGVMARFADEILGCKVRFRPSYFPFTEPSAEFDFSCLACGGSGRLADHICRICKGEGWLEISGAGMVHPQVLRNVGYDPTVYSGFAWGMGADRIALLKYGISNIRFLWEDDLRLRRQLR
ncbi:MAG TPA: phenylalanine--tRNA ligase subunit alpha [Ktedonosporobacter sp.]|jgi:phenylalanyl-tRNA synthetase alpha chain|nr:phenylalanine--tRNA ligase subunit alpha [Ktedonosporobacter sp.]